MSKRVEDTKLWEIKRAEHKEKIKNLNTIASYVYTVADGNEFIRYNATNRKAA